MQKIPWPSGWERKRAGKILGTITVLDAIGGGLGIWLTGVLYTRQESYQVAFTIFSVLIVIALFAITRVRYPDQAPVAAPTG